MIALQVVTTAGALAAAGVIPTAGAARQPGVMIVAAGAAPVLRKRARPTFRTGATPAATIMTPGWRAAPALGMTPAAAKAPAVVTTWSAIKSSLATLDSGGDRWLAVPVYELPS